MPISDIFRELKIYLNHPKIEDQAMGIPGKQMYEIPYNIHVLAWVMETNNVILIFCLLQN